MAIDSDGDGLDDSVETNTGVYVNESNTGTDPNNSDTDGDFLKDGLEVTRGLSPVTHFDFSGDETTYTYIPSLSGDNTVDNDSPFATSNSTSSEDVWDINNGATVTQASVAYDPPAERVLGFGSDGVILRSNTDFIFNIPEEKLIKGVYIHAGGDRSTNAFRLYAKNQSGDWVEHVNISFLDSGRIPYRNNPVSDSVIFAVDFPDFIGSEFKMQFGPSNSRLTNSEPRLYHVDAVTETLPTFQIIEGNFTWQEAKADAEAKGGRLAVLDTQEKIDAANTYLEELGEWPDLMIGLTDQDQEGQWQWITDDVLTADNWWDGEPNGGTSSNYVQLLRSNNVARLRWNDITEEDAHSYLLEILERPPAPPVVELESFYESNPNETIVVDARPVSGFPEEFTYQWTFNNGFPIPSFLGGTQPVLNLAGDPSQDGTWTVVVSNTVGSTEASFEYRVFVDNDSDGLSNYREENFTLTNPDLADSDSDGLNDPDELSIHGTDPNIADVDNDGLNDSEEIAATTDPSVADTDSDGLLDGIEVKTYGSNPKATDTDNDGIADAAEASAGLDINTAESISEAVAFLTEELSKRPPQEGFEAAIVAAKEEGRDEVINDPSSFDLVDASDLAVAIAERDSRFMDTDGDGITDIKESELETSTDEETVFYLQSAYDLATNQALASGRNEVINAPASFDLFTLAQYTAIVADRDSRFADSDGDGITDAKEEELQTDSSNETVFYLQDAYELANSQSRQSGRDEVTGDPAAFDLVTAAQHLAVVADRDSRFIDTDGDGLTDVKEAELQTNSQESTAFYLQSAYDFANEQSLQAGRDEVTSDPATYNLFTVAQYLAVVNERDARPTKQAYDAVVAQRDARPTAEAYDTAIAERDA
ncbi:hypothetical protein OAH21_02325, partial [bacterium]|nr:hypothetical protein [bacterium]